MHLLDLKVKTNRTPQIGKTHLIKITHLLPRLMDVQVPMSQHRRNSVRDKMRAKK